MPPFILHIPHASTIIPAHHRARLLLSEEALTHEAKRMADLHTDELFAVEEGLAQAIVFPISRCVVDPERFVDDAKEAMAAQGMGVIYEKTSTGAALRFPPSAENREILLEDYYQPHHARLTQAVDDALDAHGQCILLDCHSFPERRWYDRDQTPGEFPDICLGTDDFHTPEWLTDLAIAHFRSAGWSVEVNRPFNGTLVPAKHWEKNPKVSSLMVEIHRRLYLDDACEKRPDFQDFKARFQQTLRQFMLKAQVARPTAG